MYRSECVPPLTRYVGVFPDTLVARLPLIAWLEREYNDTYPVYGDDGKVRGYDDYFERGSWNANVDDAVWVQPMFQLKSDGGCLIDPKHPEERLCCCQGFDYRQDWRIGREMTEEETRRWALSNSDAHETHAHTMGAPTNVRIPVPQAASVRGYRADHVILDECVSYVAVDVELTPGQRDFVERFWLNGSGGRGSSSPNRG